MSMQAVETDGVSTNGTTMRSGLVYAFAKARKAYRNDPKSLAALMIAAMFVASELEFDDEDFDKDIRKKARKL